jgi:uncharacterized protein (TIGR04255 family)
VTAATYSSTPFDGAPVDEIPLARAPLVRVLAQARFENLAVFKRENFINPLIERLLDHFPLLEEGYETELIVGPSGVSQKDSSSPVWRLRSLDRRWTVTVSPGSLAIETTAYESRTDFLHRFENASSAFIETIGASIVVRLGMRYTNQILNETIPVSELISFFRPDSRGALSIPSGETTTLQHAINDALFTTGDRAVQGRWGLLPSGAIFDPSIAPVPHQSWFLDIDSSTATRLEMNSAVLAEELQSLSERAYRLFRWLVTERFIERFRDN